jgi:hypothetical protein
MKKEIIKNVCANLCKLILFCATFIHACYLAAQVNIKPTFYGQNAQLPGTFTDFQPSTPVDFYKASCSYCFTVPGHSHTSSQTDFGELDNLWDEVQMSGAQIVRVGGTDYNEFEHAQWDYRWQVEQIKNKGMVPVVQVGVGIPGSTNLTPSKAANLVTYLNITNAATSYCKYWIVGNEYDKIGYTAQECSTKIADFSIAMKAVDPTIKIIGPGLSSFSPGSTTYVNDLTSTYNILPYIDIFSFHV